MNRTVIIDIDGTISKVGERIKYLQSEPKDWEFVDGVNWEGIDKCGDCLYYLTCNSESRDKQICDNYDNEP